MLKQKVQYKDFDGTPCEEVIYFNLMQSELVTMQAEHNGGLVEHLTNVMQAGDGKIIMDTFKWLIEKSYGVRSPDGKRFLKSPELSKAFTETMAFDAFFMALMTGGAQAAAEFIAAVVPQEISNRLPTAEQAVAQVTLYNETPVTEENVPPLEKYVPQEGSFSALAAARLGAPSDTQILNELVEETSDKPNLKQVAATMSTEELRALLLERESE